MRIWTVATCKESGTKGQGSVFCVRRPTSGISHFTFYVLRFTHHASRSLFHIQRFKGFTLLELSLVLFIVGLLVTVVLPRFGAVGSARLESSARRLATLVRYLNGEAAFNGRTYRISYDLGEQSYTAQVLVPSRGTAEFVTDPSPMARPVRLPVGITFADVRIASVGRVQSGQVFTHFYPHGYVDPTVVHLRDQQERVMTVVIPPLTGEAQVYEGYVDGSR